MHASPLMVSPFGFQRNDQPHQGCGEPLRQYRTAINMMGAVLLFLPQVIVAQTETGENPVLPEIGEISPGVLPDLSDPPFLALPYKGPESPGETVVAPVFQLPPVAGFLPARAHPVPTVRFDRFHFDGNTVFSDAELDDCIKGFLHKTMLPEDLDQLRFEITRLYVSNGYLNSGATIPAQDLRDGILDIHITEGRLTTVISRGNKELSDGFLSSRILVNRSRPLHFPTLQRQLQVLQENPNIARLNAELKPGLVPGEALMVVMVEEAPKWSYGLDFHNQRSPSVGGEQAEVWFENRNLTGYSDTLRARLGLFSGNPEELDFAGLDNYSIQYERPILADDTTLQLGWSSEDYSILEEPFTSLAIEGESHAFFAGIRRPLYRSLEDEVWASFLLEKSHDETAVLGRPFSISPGSVNGKLDLTILRFGLDWTRRTRESVFSLRSTVSAGIDAFGATEQQKEPDSEFLTWLLESQFSRRLDKRGDLLVLHGGLGLANDPLPPPAQLCLGGRYTVRGYRENFLVRDNGIYGGVDIQVPLLTDEKNKSWNLWLVPFIDGGVGWNVRTPSTEALFSAGLGIRANYSDWFRAELFYGVPVKNREDPSDDLQDEGIHFRISLARF
ncbi:MAG: ShlB/FhaC/HecB family hemolysin secretion/activation protein [Luteolibacter sp.]